MAIFRRRPHNGGVECNSEWNKKLSYRRETARRFVSFNILLSHSTSLKVIRNDTSEWIGRVLGHWKWRRPTDHTTFYWSGFVSIALCWTISSYWTLNNRDLEIRVYRSLTVIQTGTIWKLTLGTSRSFTDNCHYAFICKN